MGIANKLTVARMAAVPLVILFAGLGERWKWGWLAAGIIFVFAAVTDVIDGHLARTRGEVSNFGKLMDPIADKLLVISALLMLNKAGMLSIWVTLCITLREFIISGIRQMAAANAGRVIAAGTLGKIKTVLQCIGIPCCMIGYALIPYLFWPVLNTVLIGQWILYASAALAVVSGVEYIARNAKWIIQKK